MQRPTYNNPAPAHSPPLHHPVPQHVSTVPQLRSPPPPVPPSQPGSGYGYGQPQGGAPPGGGGGGYNMHPAFGGFMNDPTAQMGFQVGKSAVMAAQDYADQHINRWVNVGTLKHYFNVSNSYVANKLYIVLFPWWHKPWSRQQRLSNNGQDGFYLPPREDINSPDMYIPSMAVVTYILLSTLLAGLRGAFHPELLGATAATAFVVVILEIICLKVGTYILSISSESQLFDLVAYSGYKFVGIILTLLVGEILNRTSLGTGSGGTGGWIGWIVFLYTFGANAFFLLRSLRYVLLPDQGSNAGPGGAASYTVARSQRNRRTQFLFVYSYVVQFIFMWLLSRQSADPKLGVKA